MSDLFSILYSDPNEADNAMKALSELERTGEIILEDSCAVVKDSKGYIHLHQQNNLSLIGSIVGLAIGTILGWFVLMPYMGIPTALLGALVGKFTDLGIKDYEMKDFSKEMKVNSSALFFLIRGPGIERVLKQLAPFGGRIFHTSLAKYQENELEEKLEQLRNRYLKEAENPTEIHFKTSDLTTKEEVVVVREESISVKAPGKKFRVVWYYSQWPQGGEYDVLANGLTLEEAEMLKEKSDPNLKGEYVLIEEETTGPQAESLSP